MFKNKCILLNMASLTERSLIYDFNNSSNSSPNNNNSNKNNWYDRVYLCVEHKGETQIIGNFHCYPFESYEKADEYSKNISYIYLPKKIICII